MQSIDAIRASLAPVFCAHDVDRVVLFGSVAKGTATDNSDLDLLVDSNLHGLRFVGLIEDIRAAAGMPVDVFAPSHIERGSLIDREIHATGVTIYEK